MITRTPEQMTEVAGIARKLSYRRIENTDYWRGIEDALRWATGSADPEEIRTAIALHAGADRG